MVADAPGSLYVVATPIGNLDDLSPRAVDTLRTVDVIAAEDTRHTRRLCERFGIGTAMLALHEHNERAAGEGVLARLRAGRSVALVSDAGTPLISDPGFALVRECRRAGLPVVCVPGPSALAAALSVSGLPTDRFRFEGFLPRKAAARRERLRALRGETATLVWYESPHRVQDALDDMAAVFGGARAAVLARELTKLHETVLSLPLAELVEAVRADPDQRRGELVLMVAGAPEAPAGEAELERVLDILLGDLPVKHAATLAARLTGCGKNRDYEFELRIEGRGR
ncbi:MAG: 16S rRNA (cytidine(1402)-2'-O)-methyltransferase [Gammaproteobacteria bacterium]